MQVRIFWVILLAKMPLQFDIHAAGATVYEAVLFSARMRLMSVEQPKLIEFVDQVSVIACHVSTGVRSGSQA